MAASADGRTYQRWGDTFTVHDAFFERALKP